MSENKEKYELAVCTEHSVLFRELKAIILNFNSKISAREIWIDTVDDIKLSLEGDLILYRYKRGHRNKYILSVDKDMDLFRIFKIDHKIENLKIIKELVSENYSLINKYLQQVEGKL
jgi:hypothetical protein